MLLSQRIQDRYLSNQLTADFTVLGFGKVKLVMDRGVYSEANINGLLKEHLKFIVAVQTSLSFIRKEIDTVYDTIRSFENFDEQHELYATTVLTEWDFWQERPNKKDFLTDKKRVCLHIYFNIDKFIEDETNFDWKLMAMRKEILNGKRVLEHERFYKKYFQIKETPVRGMQVTVNEDVVKQTKRYYGYFAFWYLPRRVWTENYSSHLWRSSICLISKNRCKKPGFFKTIRFNRSWINLISSSILRIRVTT